MPGIGFDAQRHAPPASVDTRYVFSAICTATVEENATVPLKTGARKEDEGAAEATDGAAGLTGPVPGGAVVSAAAAGTGLILSVPASPGGIPTPGFHAQSIILVAVQSATTSTSAAISWVTAAAPAIGTTLVDATDGDQVLPWRGGTVTYRITYTGPTPGAEYTVSGELMRKTDASATGMTASTTFTPTMRTRPSPSQPLRRSKHPVGAPPTTGHSSVGEDSLAATGGTQPIGLASAAALAVLAGAALLIARRRRAA